MKKIIFYFTTLTMILLLASCSHETPFDGNEKELLIKTKPVATRTISLTATMPNDDPSTRVGLEQLDNRCIALTWEEGDKLQLAFVERNEWQTVKMKTTVTVSNISENKKRAQFDITIPDGFNFETFDLYGIYGGGGLSDDNPTEVILPTNTDNIGSLTSVEEKEHVMLYFTSKNIDANNPQVSVVFQHLGSLFCIEVKNIGTTSLNNLSEAQLVEVGGHNNWAFNCHVGGCRYDLITKKYLNTKATPPSNYISFRAPNSTLPSGQSIIFWGWYPASDVVWPELKLQLSTTTTITSVNTKPARENPTDAGKCYYFYAKWDGSQLGFTNNLFTPASGLYLHDLTTMGSLNTIPSTERDDITAMKITGEIKNADFGVIKSLMPQLRYLDLSEVTREDKRIPTQAFAEWDYSNTCVSTIILPMGIETIGARAFYKCCGLTGTLNLPANLKTIESDAFHDCSSLTGGLNLPAGLKTIGVQAFSGCSGFTTLTIPNGVTTIEKEAFQDCSSIIGNVAIPTSLAAIGAGGFYGCKKQITFYFPHSTVFPYSDKMLPKDAVVKVPANLVETYKTADGWKDRHAGKFFAIE